MKATEFRIGNLYRYNDLPITAMTSYELNNFYETKNNDYDDRDKYYKPIPLTEEWLLKFGFKKDDDVYIKTSGRQSISIPRYNEDDDYYVLYQEDIGCGYNPLRYIEYIHQLQNLYFALTNKELTLKE